MCSLTLCQAFGSSLYGHFMSLNLCNSIPATVPFLCQLTVNLWSKLILSPLFRFPFIPPLITIELLSPPSNVKVTNHLHVGKLSRPITTMIAPYLTFWQHLAELTKLFLRASKAGPSQAILFLA